VKLELSTSMRSKCLNNILLWRCAWCASCSCASI